MKISIQQAKSIREQFGFTHLIIFGVSSDGKQHVATHGENRKHAREAATFGNELKKTLGWPKEDCSAIPLQRICKNCVYYNPDYGIHCFNGWSKDGSKGHCRFEPTQTYTAEDSTCHNFEPNC